MKKERFIEILLEEGYSLPDIDSIWEEAMQMDVFSIVADVPEEERTILIESSLRETAQMMLPEYRRRYD